MALQIFGGTSGGGNAAASSTFRESLEGMPLYVYGHSFTPVPGFYCTPNGGEWASRIASRFKMTMTNKGMSGAKMADTATGIIGSAARTGGGDRHHPAGANGVVIIESEVNDVYSEANVANVAFQTGWKHALRASLAACSAKTRIEDSAGTAAVGTWSTLSATDFSGGSVKYTTVQGNAYEYAGVVAPTGYVYLLTLANDATNTAGTVSVSVDGADQGISYAATGQMKQHTSGIGGAAYTYCPAVIKVTVPNTGSHTIRITKTDATVAAVYTDGILIPSLKPPIVLVCKDPPTDSTAAATVGGTIAAAFATYAPTFHALTDSVVAEFSNASTVDLATSWSNPSCEASRDTAGRFHPNDKGMIAIANDVQTALLARASTVSNGLNVL